MTDVLRDVLWVEKYRPTTLEEMALEPETRQLLESYLAAEEIPHLLLVGPPGSGKTTVARILLGGLDCRVLNLNASSERGIDVVRDKIGSFVTANFGFRWNIPFLDEADAMTSDAQTALRNLIESYADQSRFILTANYEHRIIDPLRSRCQRVMLGRPPVKERYRILARVLQAEGIETEPRVTLGYAERYPDMRKMLNMAQQAFLRQGGRGTLTPAVAEDRADGLTMLDFLEKKNWTGLRRLVGASEFDPQQGLKDLFWAIPDTHRRVGFLRHIIGRGVHESGFTPDPVVLFLGVCAEAMEGL